MPRRPPYLGMGLHVVLAAATYIVGRHAAIEFQEPLALAFARALISTASLLLLGGWVIPWPRFSRREWLSVLGLGILLVPLNQAAFLIGLKDTVPGHPAAIYAMTPAGVLILTACLDRRWPSRAHLVGVVLALIGAVIVTRPWAQGPRFAEIRRGDLWMLGGLVIWVFYTVLARRVIGGHDFATVTTWTMALGTLVLAPIAAPYVLAEPFARLPLVAWVGLIWLGLVTSTAMMLLWNRMLVRLAPVDVAICTNAQPPMTALLVALTVGLGLEADLGSQDLGLAYWSGTALVLAGVTTVILGRPRPPEPAR